MIGHGGKKRELDGAAGGATTPGTALATVGGDEGEALNSLSQHLLPLEQVYHISVT
ncbi:hypothetical protein M1O52_04370 [Dehalococcoidia bacterium]|nr:hypothetical protein [Dehalococcoidia bacterium]